MVGPVSSEERSAFAVKVKLALTGLVGTSAGLIALQADASLWTVLAAVVAGLIVGGPLVWFVFRGAGDVRSARRRR